jgi:hypothetical protein
MHFWGFESLPGPFFGAYIIIIITFWQPCPTFLFVKLELSGRLCIQVIGHLKIFNWGKKWLDGGIFRCQGFCLELVCSLQHHHHRYVQTDEPTFFSVT